MCPPNIVNAPPTLAADFGSLRSRRHALHRAAEFHELRELARVCKHIVDALAACAEDQLLMNRLRIMGNYIFTGSASWCRKRGQTCAQ